MVGLHNTYQFDLFLLIHQRELISYVLEITDDLKKKFCGIISLQNRILYTANVVTKPDSTLNDWVQELDIAEGLKQLFKVNYSSVRA